MAYTAMKTWTPVVLPTTDMNTYIRDNLKAIMESASIGMVLPTAPVDGQLFWYIADGSARIVWGLKYNNAGPTGKKWEAAGPQPLRSHVAAPSKTGGSAYVGLGPSLTVPLGGEYYFQYGVAGLNASSVTGLLIAPGYAGGAASDGDSAGMRIDTAGSSQPGSAIGVSPLKVLNAGDAVTLYQRDMGASGVGAQLVNAFLFCWPVRIG